MNKKLILLIAAGLMAAQLLGCGNNKQESVEVDCRTTGYLESKNKR